MLFLLHILVRPSRIAFLFTGSFLVMVYVLQWWQRASYPIWLWTIIGLFGIFGLIKVGWAPRATGGVAAGGGELARGAFFFPPFFCRADKRKGSPVAACICIFSIASSLALLSVSHSTRTFTSQTIPTYANGQYITIEGVITREPSGKPPANHYPVQVVSVTSSGITTTVTGTILVEDVGGWPQYAIGDRITAQGKLEIPKQIEDFDYPHYLRIHGISAILRRAAVQSNTTPASLSLKRHLQSTKLRFLSRINRLFPEPEASLIAGLLTGERRGFSEHMLSAFRTTGLTHLIAISGTNITILISIFGSLLFWLPLKWRFVPQVTVIMLFTLLVGASASVVRASIMGILGLTALQLGRIADTRLAIAWTAMLMTAWKPEQLWWDAGFQLSFAAIIGVTEIGPRLKKAFAKIPETLGLRDSLAATLAAQGTTLPISVFTFGQISLIAPLSNILAAPLVPIAMLFGFLGTMLSMFSMPLGQLVGFAGYGAAEWIVGVANILAQVPYASIQL